MGSDYAGLLLHIHVRWLSRGKILTRLFDLKTEVKIFLKDKNHTQVIILKIIYG